MKASCYRNLHKKCWSMLATTGRVFGWAGTVRMQDCTFVVRPAGRRQALKEQRKSVHAFCRGTLDFWGWVPVRKPRNSIQIFYRLYNGSGFETKEGKPVKGAQKVLLDCDGRMWAAGVFY